MKLQSNNKNGFTLLELLVSMTIASFVFAGLMSQYQSSVQVARDHQIRVTTQVQAQAIVQTVISELRMLGNGVPFDQANFQIGEDTLSDITVTEPIQISSATATHITFRLNETGEVFLLTQDFDPAVDLEVHLTEVTNLSEDDPIYLSNSVVAGDDGLYGTIDSVDTGAKSITLHSDYVASPAATFDMGSICEEVPLVTYDSPDDLSGVTRDSGPGAVLLGENSTMALTYLNVSGTAMTLPLTNTEVVNSLRSIRVAVSVTSNRELSSGQPYTTTVTQTVGLRNLNYLF